MECLIWAPQKIHLTNVPELNLVKNERYTDLKS